MVNSITKCFIGLILLFGLGCNQSAKQSVTIKKTDTITTKKATGTTTYVTWDSVKLNGTIPMLYNLKEAEEKLGKADSIITPDYENVSSSFFNNKSFKYCYFRGITFEKSGDTLAFMSIDFTKASTAYLGNDHTRLWNNRLLTVHTALDKPKTYLFINSSPKIRWKRRSWPCSNAN